MRELEPKSSCGTGYFSRYKTIGEALGWNGFSFDDQLVEELWAMVIARLKMLEDGQLTADNIKVFVKQEPHKLAKLEEGRLRLISAVSLTDAMVDRILFGWLTKAALADTLSTPSAVGWVPIQGGWRAARAMFGERVVCLDKSAWDWTVQPWLVESYLLLIKGLALDAPIWWTTCVEARFKLLFTLGKFEFANGTIIPQQGTGIMKSGCYLTILLNTLGQVLVHFVSARDSGNEALTTLPLAMGDDTAQNYENFIDLEAYIRAVHRLGPRVKESQVCDHLDFAGFRMTESKCWPAYNNKHIYKLEYTSDIPGFLKNMQYLYAHHPEGYKFWRNKAKNICPEEVLPLHRVVGFMG